MCELKDIMRMVLTKLTPMDEKLDGVTAEVGRLSDKASAQDIKIEKLTKRLDRLEGRPGDTSSTFAGSATHSSSDSFVPQAIEVRGFCKFADRMVNGVSREMAAEVVASIKNALPSQERHKISGLITGPEKQYFQKVGIKGNAAHDVAAQLQEWSLGHATWPGFLAGRRLTVRPEEPPDVKRRKAKFAMVMETIKPMMDAESRLEGTWAPEFLAVKCKAGAKKLIAQVMADGTVRWDPSVQSEPGCDAAQLDSKVLYRQCKTLVHIDANAHGTAGCIVHVRQSDDTWLQSSTMVETFPALQSVLAMEARALAMAFERLVEFSCAGDIVR